MHTRYELLLVSHLLLYIYRTISDEEEHREQLAE